MEERSFAICPKLIHFGHWGTCRIMANLLLTCSVFFLSSNHVKATKVKYGTTCVPTCLGVTSTADTAFLPQAEDIVVGVSFPVASAYNLSITDTSLLFLDHFFSKVRQSGSHSATSSTVSNRRTLLFTLLNHS